MAVFVDALRPCLRNPRWKWPKACHMFVGLGGLDELHAFAKQIGMRREWFQDKTVPHYDLNERRRIAAVNAGAVELDNRSAVFYFRRWREFRPLRNVPVLCGLREQGHLPTIEKMIAEGRSWEEIGREIGWCPATARQHFEQFEH